MYFRIFGSFKSAKDNWVANCKSDPQIVNPQMLHLWKIFKSENLRICDLRNLFVDRQPFFQQYIYCTVYERISQKECTSTVCNNMCFILFFRYCTMLYI